MSLMPPCSQVRRRPGSGASARRAVGLGKQFGEPAQPPETATRLRPVSWFAVPRGWVESFGDIARFGAQCFREVYGGRVFRFFGEALRQSGLLILSSTLVIWGLVFII